MALDSHICRIPISDRHDHRYNLQMSCKQSYILHRQNKKNNLKKKTISEMCVYMKDVFYINTSRYKQFKLIVKKNIMNNVPNSN